MSLLLVFAALFIVGEALNFMLAVQIERFSETAGMVVFFTLLAVVVVIAWKLAVRLTEPKEDSIQGHQP